jgi:hypothetical protein
VNWFVSVQVEDMLLLNRALESKLKMHSVLAAGSTLLLPWLKNEAERVWHKLTTQLIAKGWRLDWVVPSYSSSSSAFSPPPSHSSSSSSLSMGTSASDVGGPPVRRTIAYVPPRRPRAQASDGASAEEKGHQPSAAFPQGFQGFGVAASGGCGAFGGGLEGAEQCEPLGSLETVLQVFPDLLECLDLVSPTAVLGRLQRLVFHKRQQLPESSQSPGSISSLVEVVKPTFAPGDWVLTQWPQDGRWYFAKVTQVHRLAASEGVPCRELAGLPVAYDVEYEDGNVEKCKGQLQLRELHGAEVTQPRGTPLGRLYWSEREGGWLPYWRGVHRVRGQQAWATPQLAEAALEAFHLTKTATKEAASLGDTAGSVGGCGEGGGQISSSSSSDGRGIDMSSDNSGFDDFIALLGRQVTTTSGVVGVVQAIDRCGLLVLERRDGSIEKVEAACLKDVTTKAQSEFHVTLPYNAVLPAVAGWKAAAVEAAKAVEKGGGEDTAVRTPEFRDTALVGATSVANYTELDHLPEQRGLQRPASGQAAKKRAKRTGTTASATATATAAAAAASAAAKRIVRGTGPQFLAPGASPGLRVWACEFCSFLNSQFTRRCASCQHGSQARSFVGRTVQTTNGPGIVTKSSGKGWVVVETQAGGTYRMRLSSLWDYTTNSASSGFEGVPALSAAIIGDGVDGVSPSSARSASSGSCGGGDEAAFGGGLPTASGYALPLPAQRAGDPGMPKNWSFSLLNKKVVTKQGVGVVTNVIDKGWIEVRLDASAGGRKIKTRPGNVTALEGDPEVITAFAKKTKALAHSSTSIGRRLRQKETTGPLLARTRGQKRGFSAEGPKFESDEELSENSDDENDDDEGGIGDERDLNGGRVLPSAASSMTALLRAAPRTRHFSVNESVECQLADGLW